MLDSDALTGDRPKGNECATCWYLSKVPASDAAVITAWLGGSHTPAQILSELANDPDCMAFPLPPKQSMQRHRLNGHGAQS